MTTLRARPGPLDTLDGPGTELDLLWDQMADVVEATEAVANATQATANAALASTPEAVGGVLYLASEKTASVGTDFLLLLDSQSSNALKRISVTNISSSISAAIVQGAALLSGAGSEQAYKSMRQMLLVSIAAPAC